MNATPNRPNQGYNSWIETADYYIPMRIKKKIPIKISEPVGIIIRSKEIATALKSIFNFIWDKTIE